MKLNDDIITFITGIAVFAVVYALMFLAAIVWN